MADDLVPAGETSPAPAARAEPPATTDAGADTARKVPRWRRILVGVLVVIVCILAPISAIAVWVSHTLLDTDQYVATVGPLADNPAVQNATANRVTTAVITGTGIETKIKDALPPRAAFIAPSVTNGLESFVHQAALKFLSSDRWQSIWENANRLAHKEVVAILKGEGTKTVNTKQGKVVIDITPVANRVQKRLESLGVDVLQRTGGKGIPHEVVLIDSESLGKVQGLVKALDSLSVILPILTLLLLVVALVLSPRRRRTLLRAAIGVAFAVGLLLVIFNLLRSVYLDSLPKSVSEDAAAAVYDQLLSFLRDSLRVLFAVFAVIAIGAWIAGPGRYATLIRERTLALVRRDGTDTTQGAVSTFVAAHLSGLRVAVIGLGLVILVALDHPGVGSAIAIAVIVLVALLVLEFIGGRARTAEPVS
jgi:hypothetical protein